LLEGPLRNSLAPKSPCDDVAESAAANGSIEDERLHDIIGQTLVHFVELLDSGAYIGQSCPG